MKHFRNIGILAIAAFSFIYTEKIANLTLENSEIYQKIKNEEQNYNVSFVNAEINDQYITPGLNGKVVNIKNSFYNMKDLNAFNSYYLIFDTSYPEVTLENNKDKIVNKGNRFKKSVSFIIEYNKEIIDYFKENDLEASILVNVNTFNKNEKLEQINNEVEKYKELESLINKYSNNTHICYVTSKNEDICRKNQKFLVKTDKILNNKTFITLKNRIEPGDIYYIEKGADVKNIKILINSIIYKDLDIISLSKVLSEERD